jgi:hypothetical protein
LICEHKRCNKTASANQVCEGEEVPKGEEGHAAHVQPDVLVSEQLSEASVVLMEGRARGVRKIKVGRKAGVAEKQSQEAEERHGNGTLDAQRPAPPKLGNELAQDNGHGHGTHARARQQQPRGKRLFLLEEETDCGEERDIAHVCARADEQAVCGIQVPELIDPRAEEQSRRKYNPASEGRNAEAETVVEFASEGTREKEEEGRDRADPGCVGLALAELVQELVEVQAERVELPAGEKQSNEARGADQPGVPRVEVGAVHHEVYSGLRDMLPNHLLERFLL